jgi:hypothetical protein
MSDCAVYAGCDDALSWPYGLVRRYQEGCSEPLTPATRRGRRNVRLPSGCALGGQPVGSDPSDSRGVLLGSFLGVGWRIQHRACHTQVGAAHY